MKKLLFSLLMAGIFSTGVARAQNEWHKVVSMPPGGNIKDMASDNAGTIYALTAEHTNVFYTTDNGANWTLMPNTSELWLAHDIEVDKVTGKLYLASKWFGVEWTADKGLHWSEERFHSVPGGFYAEITHVGTKHGTGRVVVSEFTGSGASVFTSANNGVTWTGAFSLPWAAASELKFISDGTLLVGANNGIFRSADDGLTWTSSTFGVAGQSVVSIAEKTSNGHLFAAVAYSADTFHSGVFISVDNGHSWAGINAGITNRNMRCVEFDSVNNKLYAVSTTGVYESADEGVSWTLVSAGIANTRFNSIVKGNSGLFLATNMNGVAYADTPATTSWIYKNKGLAQNSFSDLITNHNNIDIHTIDEQNSGVYKLAGTSWTHQSNGLPLNPFAGMEILNDNNDVLYAVYDHWDRGIYRSLDNGNTWTDISAGVAAFASGSAVRYSGRIDRQNRFYLIATNMNTAITDVFRSVDSGSTWSVFISGASLGFDQVVDLDFGQNDIYVTTHGATELITVSHDDGVTYDTVAFNLGDLFGGNLCVADNDSLYLQKFDHIFKRSGINNWRQFPDATWNHDYNNYPLSLYIDKHNHLFASSTKTGVFYSGNDSTWTDISIGLPIYSYIYEPLPVVLTPNDIKFDMANVPYAICTHRYAGTIPGIYKFGAPTAVSSLQTTPAKLAVYPNPATNRIAVSYNGVLAHTMLQLYNVTGQLIKSMEIRNDIEILDIEQLVPGVYFMKLVSGNSTAQATFVKQ